MSAVDAVVAAVLMYVAIVSVGAVVAGLRRLFRGGTKPDREDAI